MIFALLLFISQFYYNKRFIAKVYIIVDELLAALQDADSQNISVCERFHQPAKTIWIVLPAEEGFIHLALIRSQEFPPYLDFLWCRWCLRIYIT